MNECKWCNQQYEYRGYLVDDGFCSAQCRHDWDAKAKSMGLLPRYR